MQIPGHHAIGSPFEQRQAAGAVAAQSSAASSSASGSASSSSGTANATITANDFLQLLVTELQNQDPTADTDPNEYVDQLVQVNSLQQLIQMNQTLDGGPTLTGASSGVLQQLNQVNEALDGDLTSSNGQANSARLAASAKAPHAKTGGNLSPVSNAKLHAAAERVASALSPGAQQAIGAEPTQAFAEFAERLRAGAQ